MNIDSQNNKKHCESYLFGKLAFCLLINNNNTNINSVYSIHIKKNRCYFCDRTIQIKMIIDHKMLKYEALSHILRIFIIIFKNISETHISELWI